MPYAPKWEKWEQKKKKKKKKKKKSKSAIKWKAPSQNTATPRRSVGKIAKL
jgi:hypothetical protein